MTTDLSPTAPKALLARFEQADAGFLQKVAGEFGPFDLIIDDGSHVNAHVITTFEVLFPLLKTGGLYVVEDTQTSYWPVLGGSSRNLRLEQTID